MKRNALDIGLAEQIGGGFARRDARINQFGKPFAFLRQQPRIQKGFEFVDRQMQGFENYKGCLVQGIGCAVTIGKPGRLKAGDGVAQEVAQGAKMRRRGVRKWHDFVPLGWQPV